MPDKNGKLMTKDDFEVLEEWHSGVVSSVPTPSCTKLSRYLWRD